MLCVILALALCTQFATEPPIVGNDVVVLQRYRFENDAVTYRGIPIAGTGIVTFTCGPVHGYSSPHLYTAASDANVPSGQLAKVVRKFATLGGDTYFVLQLPDNKTITVGPDSRGILVGILVIKVTNLELTKKIFAELQGLPAEVAKKKTTKKIQAKFIAKRRQEVAKKYRLDLQTLDLIELMGRTNGW